MTITVEPETAPLTRTVDGVILVGNTRVPLETVIESFRDGATAETIVDRYPTLTLADTYSTIAYYLRHQTNVDAYLSNRERTRVQIQSENERRFPAVGIRARLLARLPGIVS